MSNLPDDVTLAMIDGKPYKCDECPLMSYDDSKFVFCDDGTVLCIMCAMEVADDPDEDEGEGNG